MSTPLVWLIDNDPSDIALVERALDQSGSGVELAVLDEDGLSPSLDALAAGAKAPTLVLLDLKLDHSGGLAHLRALRAHEHACWVPVVVWSSSDDPGDIAAAYAAGTNGYLRKPVRYDDFAALVTTAVHYWTRLNVLPRGRG